jgi:hypothetical protein
MPPDVQTFTRTMLCDRRRCHRTDGALMARLNTIPGVPTRTSSQMSSEHARLTNIAKDPGN